MNNTKRIAIIGAGAAGCVCAYFLIKSGYQVTVFDKGAPLRTLLPTGGGRCNLAHAEFEPKELAENYPRGKNFLYSVFSKFSTYDTLSLFDELGIETYAQDDGRIFPASNSSKEVQTKILKHVRNIKKENVTKIQAIDNDFKITTNKSEYLFTHVVIAIGGHSGYEIFKDFGLNIINPKPALVGLNTRESLKELSGIKLGNINCKNFTDSNFNWNNLPILFTHFGISGPLIYKISSLKAFDNYPYQLDFDLCPDLTNFQNVLNNNPHKEIKNILSEYLPLKVVKYLLKGIDETIKACNIDGNLRDLILSRIHNFSLTITGTNNGEETVTAGGVDLNEIDSKSMMSKKIHNLYFIGEVLNIDGFCGGFNLQNAWSTAYVAACSIIE